MSSIGIDRHNNMNAPRRDASQRRLSSSSRSPRLVPLSGGTRLSSSSYRPRSRSLASPSLWIPPPPPAATATATATTHSPSLSSLSSTGGERGGRQSPLLLLPPPATATTTKANNGTTTSRRTRTCSVSTTTTTTSTTTTATSSSSSSTATPKIICHDARTRQQALRALQTNDDMVYLDGPAVYACQTCRTHLTTHDDIISKSFHGRRGRAFLFDSVVNITTGPPEDRLLITGLHAVCDIFCRRCRTLVGWTYQRAYEQSQKYKEGKFILEKINLYWQESSYAYADAPPPSSPLLFAGEHRDPWQVRRRSRSHSWGGSSRRNRPWPRQDDEDKEDNSCSSHYSGSMVYEYAP